MKADLLKKLRAQFALFQRGNMFSYRRVFNTYDGTGEIKSEWTDNKPVLLEERRTYLLKYARDNYSFSKQ